MSTTSTGAVRAYRTNAGLFLVFGVAALALFGSGAALALQQRHALAHAFPVPATVVSRDVERHSPNGSGSTAYRPVVRFQYEIAGTTRMGDQLGPLRESRGGHWAWEVLDRYEVGQHVTAWVRDDVPDVAYLERTTSRRPYTMMAFGLVCTALVGWNWIRYRRRAAPTLSRATPATAATS